MNILKPLFVFLIILVIKPILRAQQNDKTNVLQDEIEEFSKELKNGILSFYAIDSKSGEIIAEKNSSLSLAPASTLKTITTATCLELFSPSHRFVTLIQYDGEVDTKNRILHGNIYIRGGGDPALGSEYFYEHYYSSYFIEKWADAIKKLNIDSIDGAIIGDASVFSTNIVPRTREWEAIGNYYGAGACGLSVFDDTYFLTFSSGVKPNDPTKIINIKPSIPDMQFVNEVKSSTVNKDRAYIFGSPYCNIRYVRGTIPLGRDEFTIKGAIPDPAYLTAHKLDNELYEKGIRTGQSASTVRRLKQAGEAIIYERKDIDTTYSPILSEIIIRTNTDSYNLYPEHLIAHIGLKQSDFGDTETGAEAITEFWKNKGMDTDGLYIHDGCGLSRYNGITAKQLVFVLRYMKTKSKHFDAFYESLPIAGKSGTMRRMCNETAAEDNLRAKSGTINKVKAYTGYVTTKSGRQIVFAMMANNYNGFTYQITQRFEKLMVIMAEIDF